MYADNEYDYNMQQQAEAEAEQQYQYESFLNELSKENPYLFSLYVAIDFLSGKKDCADAIKYLTEEKNRVENPVKIEPVVDDSGKAVLPF